MSFPAYLAYQDSGISWIGPVPAGWSVKRLRFLAQVQTGIAKGKDVQGIETIRVPYLRVANVQDGFIDIDDVSEIEIAATDLGRYLLRPGDVLMNEGGDFDKLGRGQVWDGAIDPCIHQNHVFAVRPHGIEPEWLALVTSADCGRFFFMTRAKQSTNLASISSTNLLELPVPCPPPAERRAIMRFLDREAGKIDALVAEQEGLIALLKEKRQAVISQAVTKGLGANVPLKDSGVAWLGQVPSHWEVKRVKHVTRSIEQGWSPQCDGFPVSSGDEWGVLKVGCVNGGRFNPEENKSLPAELTPIPELGVVAGDVLISRANTRELVGGAACVAVDHRNLLLCDKLYRLRLHDACLPEWLAIYLRTDAARGQIELAASGASQSMVNIGQGTILDMPIPLPAIIEQRMLVDEIEARSRDFDILTTEAQRAIALLRERRAALISAAVTGKIDVRGAIAAPAAEAA
ncbi:MAG: hypothetical protein K5Q68_06905 [Roseococcus sp.]|nr:hypothetical protein [Roseococcus sp.]